MIVVIKLPLANSRPDRIIGPMTKKLARQWLKKNKFRPFSGKKRDSDVWWPPKGEFANISIQILPLSPGETVVFELDSSRPAIILRILPLEFCRTCDSNGLQGKG